MMAAPTVPGTMKRRPRRLFSSVLVMALSDMASASGYAAGIALRNALPKPKRITGSTRAQARRKLIPATTCAIWKRRSIRANEAAELSALETSTNPICVNASVVIVMGMVSAKAIAK